MVESTGEASETLQAQDAQPQQTDQKAEQVLERNPNPSLIKNQTRRRSLSIRTTKPRLRAIVLAAGGGQRLRPLTEEVPKPLLPVLGTSIAAHTLARLAAAGVEAAALNLHHLGSQIRDRFGSRFAGMPLVYSEEPTLRGTLGALLPLKDFLSEADLVVIVNGDSLCRWPIRALIRRQLSNRPAATLLFARRPDPGLYGGGVAITRDRRVLSFGSEPVPTGEKTSRFVFAGVHVFSSELLSRIPQESPSDSIRDLYRPLVREGERIEAVLTRRRWHDLGTPRRLLDGVLDLAQGASPVPRSWIAPEAAVSKSAKVRRIVAERGVRIEDDAKVRSTLLLPGAEIGAGATVVDAVVGYGAVVPEGSWIEGGLVTRYRADVPVPTGSSRIEDLVYTPMHPPRGAKAPTSKPSETQARGQASRSSAGQPNSGP